MDLNVRFMFIVCIALVTLPLGESVVGGRSALTTVNSQYIGQLHRKYDDIYIYECGVVPIGKSHVLTTKTCVKSGSKSNLRVILEKKKAHDTGKSVLVDRITEHNDVDIAVIKLKTDIDSGNIKLQLNCSLEIGINDTAVVYGFGVEDAYGHTTHQKLSTDLKKATLKRVRRAACRLDPFPSDNEICMRTSSGSSRQNACYGDAGSPLVYKSKYLAGLVSRGPYLCHKDNMYASYVHIYTVCDWISQTVGCVSLGITCPTVAPTKPPCKLGKKNQCKKKKDCQCP